MNMMDIPLERRIIFALDVEDPEKALEWTSLLGDEIKIFKVGLELFLAGGFSLVEEIIHRGLEVMLDLKLYDIPNTVYRAVRQIKDKNVTYLTVHGHTEILRAACEASKDSELKIIAVTVLTCLNEGDLKEMGYGMSLRDLVLKRCSLALESGCAGVVSSALEVKDIKERFGEALLTITPGIRPLSFRRGDQKRVMSPGEAIRQGAHHLVIGRPIREAEDPLSLVCGIKEEIKRVLEEK